MNLKKIFVFIFICFFFLGCSNEKIKFSIITDAEFDYTKRGLDPKSLRNNCLVAKIKGNVISKFYTSYGNQLTIVSIKDNIITLEYEINLSALQLEIARKNNGMMLIKYEDEKFEPILTYPKELKSDGGSSFVLKDIEKNDEVVKLFYDYINDISAPHSGKGMVEMEFNRQSTGKYQFTNYNYNVNGYFKYDKDGNLRPSEDGDVIIKRNITREGLLNNFMLNVDNIYQ